MIRIFKGKYPILKQDDISDSGVVSVAILAKFYKLNVSIAKLRERSGTDKNGNNVMSLVQALENLGLESEGVKLNEDLLGEFNNLPAIFNIINDGCILHYVVVYELSKDEIIFADPAKGLTKMARKEFLRLWTGIVIVAKPGENFIKGDMKPNFLVNFFKLLTPFKKDLIKIFLISFLYSTLGIGGAFYFRILFNSILPEKNLKMLMYVSIGFLILNVARMFFGIYRSNKITFLNKKIDQEFVLKSFNHILNLPINFFESRKKNQILSVFKDILIVRKNITQIIITIISDTIITVSAFLLLLSLNTTLFGFFCILIIIYSITQVYFINSIEILKGNKSKNKQKYEVILNDLINGIETVKTSNRIDLFNIDLDEAYDEYNDYEGEIANLKDTKKIFTLFIKICGLISILWIGIYLIWKGTLSIGELVTFCVLAIYFIEPITNLIKLRNKIKKTHITAEKIGEILDLKLEKYSNKIDADLNGDITIKNVSFKYGSRRKIISNINIDIHKGEKIAIVGSSGSGKTTLAKLILSYYELLEGKIEINGYDIKDLPLKYLRDKVYYIPQEIYIFNKTIRENILLGKNIKEQDFDLIVKSSRCNEFVRRFPLAYDTILSDNGAILTRSEKLRIAIARAIVAKPEIYILDEEICSVDIKTEREIINILFDLMKDKTSLVITQRLNTISICNRIIVLDRGKVMEIGTHDELLKKRGKYFEMWDLLDKEN